MSAISPQTMAVLAGRMGEGVLRQRLAMESEQVSHHYRHVEDFLHPEHLPSAGRLIHRVLTAVGLRERGRSNARRIRVGRNPVRLGRLPPAFEGCTLLHLSDLHLDVGRHYVDALVATVRGLACDACVLTGDYRFGIQGSCAPAIAALARLVPVLPKPVFAVLGNHDGIALVEGLEDLGVRVLMNERTALERGSARLHIAGIDDAHYFRTHDIARARDGLAPDACAILLSHTPEPYRLAAAHGFDLMLSGHTHGGQICLPGGIPLLTDSRAPRRVARGPWHCDRMQGFTSVGCGCSIIDARFHCPPEVTVHVLHGA
ncbi:metallophosphoesterase [Variovorax ureilyticus]|uniref:Metallophosphoesterase n=1 Tax=Variovorax ureilyticus TaxID=1836198 RepID=A0ABU8VHP3_9BURK